MKYHTKLLLPLISSFACISKVFFIHGGVDLRLNIGLNPVWLVLVHPGTYMRTSYKADFVISINFELYNYLNMRFGENIENQMGGILLYCTARFLRNMQKCFI